MSITKSEPKLRHAGNIHIESREMPSASMPSLKTNIQESFAQDTPSLRLRSMTHPRSPRGLYTLLNTHHELHGPSNQRFMDFPISGTSDLTDSSDLSDTDEFQDFNFQQFSEYSAADQQHSDSSLASTETEKTADSLTPQLDVHSHQSNSERNGQVNGDSFINSEPTSFSFKKLPHADAFKLPRNDAVQFWTTPSVPEPFHLSEVMFKITRDAEACKHSQILTSNVCGEWDGEK